MINIFKGRTNLQDDHNNFSTYSFCDTKYLKLKLKSQTTIFFKFFFAANVIHFYTCFSDIHMMVSINKIVCLLWKR
jgi:hypothetical protein